MGNCAEKRGVRELVSKIMDHPSNTGRDLHTQRFLSKALSKRSIEELKKIFDDINHGKFLPDNFK